MIIEKRRYARTSVPIIVTLYHNGIKLSKCKVKDISLEGICLFSGPLAFPTRTNLKIKFPNTKYTTGDLDYVNAVVVRNSLRELGLIFDPAEAEGLGSILEYTKQPEKNMFA